jgi:hypothetical protein
MRNCPIDVFRICVFSIRLHIHSSLRQTTVFRYREIIPTHTQNLVLVPHHSAQYGESRLTFEFHMALYGLVGAMIS